MNMSVVVGTLLGDAWIQKVPNRPGSYSFAFSQGSKEYALWKAGRIDLPFTFSERSRKDPRTQKIYYSHDVRLKMNKCDKERFYNLFYSPEKEVSNIVLDMVDELALAIWYMDDGSMYYNGNNCHLTLAVNGFSQDSKDRIRRWFNDKYSMNFKHSSNAIRVTSRKECEVFMQLVEKYIPICMSYKKLSSAISKYDKTLTNEQRKYRNKRYR